MLIVLKDCFKLFSINIDLNLLNLPAKIDEKGSTPDDVLPFLTQFNLAFNTLRFPYGRNTINLLVVNVFPLSLIKL